MSEMVERVARGMHLRRPNSRTKWEDCSDEYRTGTMRDAYAAIEAMREPTEEMITILLLNMNENEDNPNISYDAKVVWQAMIDAALK